MNCDEKAALIELVQAGEKIINAALKEKELSLGKLKKLYNAVNFGKFQLEKAANPIGFAVGV